jgi:AcrR family transcriptional regulator
MNVKSEKSSDDVRQRLIDSSAKLFLKKDFNSVSIRELAEGAGTTSGMINYYFKSKNGLFEAMIKYQYELIIEEILLVLNEPGPVDFVLLIKRFQELYRKYPDMAKFEIKTFMDETAFGNQYLKYLFNLERKVVDEKMNNLIDEGVVVKGLDIEVFRILSYCVLIMPGIMQGALNEFYGEEEFAIFQDRFAENVGAMITNTVMTNKTKISDG